MTRRLLRLRALPACARAAAVLALALSGDPAEAQPPRAHSLEPPTALRISGAAFGTELEVEVLDLQRAAGEKALHAAWDAVVRAERELGALPAAAGSGRAELSPDLFSLLARASSFCTWSDGASGPAGGAVYRLWAEGAQQGALPTPDRLEEAAATAKCARLSLQAETRGLTLTAGSEIDLRGFARGWAVDIAVRTLVESGAGNLRVALGPVTRGLGAGPGGKGWPISLATLSASGNPLSRVLLVDQAIAVADPGLQAFTVAGERILPAFDLRSGRPATGVSSVAAVTTLAGDAEPLAMAMSVLGANGGQLRLGSLRPKPSVLWLLGSGETAVVASFELVRSASAVMLPAVVLVRPQQEGNIGAVARAMANMGLTELRLVEPAPELGDSAFAFAMHAHSILLGAARHASLAGALADCTYVVATASMRDRLWPHAIVTPRELPGHLAANASGARVALVFGAEVSGLTSEELARANVLVSIPAAPANPTLNLAQAVLLVAYELHVAGGAQGAIALEPVPRATVFQTDHLFKRLEELLWEVGFARDTTIRQVARDLRQLLARAGLSEREAALLSGLLRRTRNALSRAVKSPPA